MKHKFLFFLLLIAQQSWAQSFEINISDRGDTILNGGVKIIRTSSGGQSKVILYSKKDSVFIGNITMIGDLEELKDSIQKIILNEKLDDLSFSGNIEGTNIDLPYINDDTLIIGNMVIINREGPNKDSLYVNGEKFRFKWDEDEDESDDFYINFNPFNPGGKKGGLSEKISTNWGIVDIGIANFNDLTNYAQINGTGGYFPSGSSEDLVLINGKSLNINVWLFMQRISLISNVVNLKYGFGVELNNYRFKKNIRFRDEPKYFIDRDAEVDVFEKNKLAADYITIPVMLNFNLTPRKSKNYGFSAGVSAGYLYSARQKMVSEERGKEKIRNDFNLQPWKLSAVAELNLGAIQLYGSYAFGNMFRSGLNQVPYSAGIRLSVPE
jgi:hypothetical protein